MGYGLQGVYGQHKLHWCGRCGGRRWRSSRCLWCDDHRGWRGNFLHGHRCGCWCRCSSHRCVLDSVYGWRGRLCRMGGSGVNGLRYVVEVGGAGRELGLIACGGAWGRGILRGSLFVGLAGCAVCAWATLAAVAVAGTAAIAFTGFVAAALVGLARLGLVMRWGLLCG